MSADTLVLAEPISLEAFKEDIRLTGTDEDTQAARYLRAALRAVESKCGPVLPRAATVALPAGHRGRFWAGPKKGLFPIVTAPAGVSVSDIGVLTGIDPAATTLELTVGHEPVPDDLVTATFFIGSHLWEMRRGRAGRPGAYARGAEAPSGPPMTFAIPKRALELMTDHMLPGLA